MAAKLGSFVRAFNLTGVGALTIGKNSGKKIKEN